MADEENVEEGITETAEEPAEEMQGAQFVPEVASKVQPDVFTALLVLAFVCFFTGIFLAGNELNDFYDVQFWVFSKGK